jgi:hypothetical protein
MESPSVTAEESRLTRALPLVALQARVRAAGSGLALLRTLDPARDWLEIYRLHALVEFPWDTARALELALFRTYCVPSIGRLLAETREFLERPQLRYEDTSLLLAAVLAEGFSERGLAAIRRINQIHARFAISNDDMRYVLATFVMVPLRWLARFGHRPLLDAERVAAHNYYRALGTHMGIRDIPDTWQEMFALGDAYERAHFGYSPESAAVGTATRETLVRWFPRPLAPLVRSAVHALLDEPVRAGFGFPAAPRLLTAAVHLSLWTRARICALMPPARRVHGATEHVTLRLRSAAADPDTLGPDGKPLPGATEPRCPIG